MKRKSISFVGIYRKSRQDYIHQSYVVITVTENAYNMIIDESLCPPGVTIRDYNLFIALLENVFYIFICHVLTTQMNLLIIIILL